MAQIEEELGTSFTGVQVRDKFTGMVKDCKVSKIQIKEIYIVFTKKFIYILIILISQLFERYANGESNGRWTHVGEVFGEQFITPFWKRSGQYNKLFQLILIKENNY